MRIVDRRWSYVGFIVMLFGLAALVVANFQQQLGIPLDVPVGSIGAAIIASGVALYVLQRRAEQDARRSEPPAAS
jgi:hypothetical protein